jgi:hypothetical protein
VTWVLHREHVTSEPRVFLPTSSFYELHLYPTAARQLPLSALGFYSTLLQLSWDLTPIFCFTLTLHFRTTDPYFCLSELNSLLRHRVEASVYKRLPNNALCPEKAVKNHLIVNKSVPSDAPLLTFASKDGAWLPMTKDWFMRLCTKIWEDAHLRNLWASQFIPSRESNTATKPCGQLGSVGMTSAR